MAIVVEGTSSISPTGLVNVTPSASTVFLPRPTQLAVGHFYLVITFFSGLTGSNNVVLPGTGFNVMFATTAATDRALSAQGRYITSQADLDEVLETKIMAGATSTRVVALGVALSGVNVSGALAGVGAVTSLATQGPNIGVSPATGGDWRLTIVGTSVPGGSGPTVFTPNAGIQIEQAAAFSGPSEGQGASSTLAAITGNVTSVALSPSPTSGSTFQLYLQQEGSVGPVDPDPQIEDRTQIAPAINRPTITFGTMTASAAPPIVGSEGWYREKRIGSGETPPAVAQTSTADLDLNLSTRFEYIGFPGAPAHAANPGQYVLTEFKPGGAPQAARWLFSVAFVAHNTQAVALRLRSSIANTFVGQIYVNGQRISDTSYRVQDIGAGLGYYVVLTFPTSATRHISIYGLNGGSGGFGGVAVDAGGSVTKPQEQTTSRVIAFIGDSFVNGAGSPPTGANQVETFVWRLGWLMGATQIIQLGIGGTGWTTTIGGDPSSTFQGRVQSALDLNPDVVVFAGGRNDSPGVQSAVSQAVSDCLAAGKEVYVIPTATDNQTTVRAEMEAGSGSNVYVPVAQAGIEIGDGVHPTFEGHQAFADRIWSRLDPEATSIFGLTTNQGVVYVEVLGIKQGAALVPVEILGLKQGSSIIAIESL